jgi:hypothetical protein
MASKAMTATGTTTAMAIVPLFDKPLLACCGREVAVAVDEEDEVCDVGLAAVVDDVGTNVLNEVWVTVTTSPPVSVVTTGGGAGVVGGVVTGGGGVVVTIGDEVVEGVVTMGVEEVLGVVLTCDEEVEGVDVVTLVMVCVVTSSKERLACSRKGRLRGPSRGLTGRCDGGQGKGGHGED